MEFRANLLEVLLRLFSYSWAAVKLFAAQFWDKLHGNDTVDRRAARLRRAIEHIGGTAVKLGQQAAIRIDLVPYPYAMELAQMLDRVPPFPTEYAIQRIEATLKRPMDEVFSHFDPTPIGSASISTVYQAYLHTGERVAIKVRRPGIGDKFAAECRALGLVLKLLELLTIIRPGLSSNFLFEFSSMLMEELNFSVEARSTELFRRDVHSNLDNVSAPRVFFDYSGEDILVTEFVTGIWLRELLAAVETNDIEALRMMAEHGIDPDSVARSLIQTIQFSTFEGFLFHADPHPANVVVQPGNRVVFIDFGCCGAYTARERTNWRQIAYYRQEGDVGRLVQSVIAIMEPLPPIDLDELSRKVEMVFWQDMYATRSKNTMWWERTSARLWLSFLELGREYNVPFQLNTLRMIRSTLLYETITARLSTSVSLYKELRRYQKFAGKRAKKRVQANARRLFSRGFTPEHYLKIEQMGDMLNSAVHTAERALNVTPFRFMFMIDKTMYAAAVAIRTVMTIAFCVTLALTGRIVQRFATEPSYHLADVDIKATLVEVFTYKPVELLILVVLVLALRRILFRFLDIDVPHRG
jgi:predicted unusual protein kinase regulating ubiquinone biosynthesis (AarF/ABC1/UbiB family)